MASQEEVNSDHEKTCRHTNRVCGKDGVEKDFVCVRYETLIRRAGGTRREGKGRVG